MGDWFYGVARHFGRFVIRQCLQKVVLHADRARRPGGYVLACTHVSHFEPMLLSCILERPVAWMARVEFYRVPGLASFLRHTNVFPVNRQGVPVRAIRHGIRLAAEGGVVGIFPEGGCRRGLDLAIRGGRIKRGACTIATRAQVPILPVVVLGTDRLNCVDPWLPALQGKVWVAYGNPIAPPPVPARAQRRCSRVAFAELLEREFARTYRELLDHARLSDAMTP